MRAIGLVGLTRYEFLRDGLPARVSFTPISEQISVQVENCSRRPRLLDFANVRGGIAIRSKLGYMRYGVSFSHSDHARSVKSF